MAEPDPSPRIEAGSGARAGQAMRTLSEELVHASDSKILKVTRMIDGLADRGEADRLLAPVRGRLAALRPARPMTRTRLLFTPFDPVVVAAAGWQPGDPAIPRSLIQPLAALLLPGIPDDPPLDPPLDPHDADDAALTRIGAPLWAAAAARLEALELPAAWATPDWQKAHGLNAAMAQPLLAALPPVLRHAAALRDLPPADDPRCERVLGVLLSDAAAAAPAGWGIMLALLLDAAAPDQVVRAAMAVARGHRSSAVLLAGIDRATADALGRMEAAAGEPAPDELLDAGRMPARVALIDRLERFRRLEPRPAPEHRRLGRLRQVVAAASRQAFEATLRARLPGPAAAPGGTVPPLADEAVGVLEAEARQLRRFALAAGRLGEGDEYGRLLEAAALRYLDAGAASGLLVADRLRLTELLVGSERAIQIMDRR